MANEISIALSFSASKSGAAQSATASTSFTMTNYDMGGYTYNSFAAANTYYALTFPGATLPARVCFKNLGTTAVITIANTAAASYPITQLQPGDIAYVTVPASPGTVYAASTVVYASGSSPDATMEVVYCEL